MPGKAQQGLGQRSNFPFFSKKLAWRSKILQMFSKQESIPVGCVPTRALASTPGVGEG